MRSTGLDAGSGEDSGTGEASGRQAVSAAAKIKIKRVLGTPA